MTIFPLPSHPKESYHEPPRSFGSPRDGGARKHAGCDLYAPVMTPIHAVADGIVVRGPYLFYRGVFALDVRHSEGFVIRYGEISGTASGISAGSEVTAGQLIAFVGRIIGLNLSMLHFEMFRGGNGFKGPLTDVNRPPFLRREDLIDPTNFLDSCELLNELSKEKS